MTDTLTLYDMGMRGLARACQTPWTHRAGLTGLGVGRWGAVRCGAYQGFDGDGRSVRQAETLDRCTVTCCCPSSAHADMAVASRDCGDLADCFPPACWLRSVCVMSHCRNTAARALCMQLGRQAVLGYLVIDWGHSGPSCLVLQCELIVWVLA